MIHLYCYFVRNAGARGKDNDLEGLIMQEALQNHSIARQISRPLLHEICMILDTCCDPGGGMGESNGGIAGQFKEGLCWTTWEKEGTRRNGTRYWEDRTLKVGNAKYTE